jgi:hypothetical protein
MKQLDKSIYSCVPRIQHRFALGEYIDLFYTTINLKQEEIINPYNQDEDDWQPENYELQNSTYELSFTDEEEDETDFGEFMYFL